MGKDKKAEIKKKLIEKIKAKIKDARNDWKKKSEGIPADVYNDI